MNNTPLPATTADAVCEANMPQPSEAAVNSAANANGAIPATQPQVVSTGR